MKFEDGFAIQELPFHNGRKKIPLEAYKKQQAFAQRALHEYRHYLSADERRELKRVANEEGLFYRVRPEQTERRIEGLLHAGVPPIFREDFEGITTHPFPTIDFVMQYVSGRHFRNIAASVINKGKGKRFTISAANLEDVRSFRTLAFDGEKISPQIIRDIELHVRNHFNIEESNADAVLRNDQYVLKYLETALAEFPPEKREFQDYRGGMPLGFLRNSLWHIAYAPKDRERIARDYRDRVIRGETGLAREKLHFRMAFLFPEIIPHERIELIRLRVEKTMVECEQRGDFRGMEPIALTDPIYGDRYITMVKNHVEGMCRGLFNTNPEALFRWINLMYADLLVPSGVQQIPEFRDIILEHRLRFAKTLSDEEFRSFFGDFLRAVSFGNISRGKIPLTMTNKIFMAYMQDRAKKLLLPENCFSEDE